MDLFSLNPTFSGNLFTLTAWSGMAHFIFAYQGHLNRLKSIGGSLENGLKYQAIYAALLLIAASLLTSLKEDLGSTFNILVWLYFLIHFCKAERFFFASSGAKISTIRNITISLAIVLAVSTVCMPAQITVALASFYHYLRSYQFALRRKEINSFEILAINVLVSLIALTAGYVGLFDPDLTLPGLEPWLLAPVLRAFCWALDTKNFTIWVALHLVSSDCFAPLCRYLINRTRQLALAEN